MGASIASGAVIWGEPDHVTSSTDAELSVAGAGIVEYRYRVNAGAWSDPQPIENPIRLTDLADGQYTVEVVGLNEIGLWQEEDDATASSTWSVNTAVTGVRINEVLADNAGVAPHEGTLPDMVELFNVGLTPIDLSGMSITDAPERPRRFIFHSGDDTRCTTVPCALCRQQHRTAGRASGFWVECRRGRGVPV